MIYKARMKKFHFFLGIVSRAMMFAWVSVTQQRPTMIMIQCLEEPMEQKILQVELVSKELNYFGGIASFFPRLGTRDTDRWRINKGPVSLVPNLRKTTRSPQSDLTPWTTLWYSQSENVFFTEFYIINS